MTGVIIRLFVLVAIFASVFLLAQLLVGLSLNRRAEARAVNKRLRLLKAGVHRDAVTEMLRKNAPLQLGENAGLIERAYVRFQRMVLAAAIPLEPWKLLVACTVGFVGTSGLLLFLAWSSQILVTPGAIQLILGIAAAIAFGVPILAISRLAHRRRKRMESQFPLAIDIFTRSLRSGHPIASAIELLTEEMDDPIGSEFGLVADEVSYGAELNDALLSLANRWDMEDIRMFVISLSVQSETGGNLAEILENLSDVIRARASMFMKVRALSSEGRMSAWMLTALPVLTFISVVAVNPGFYFDVADDPIFTLGFAALIVLYFIGVLVIRKMVDLKV